MRVSSQSLYHVPIIGWLAKDAVRGLPDAKYYFIANMVALFAALIYEFGYPFLISVALVAAASALTFLVILTASDAFVGRPSASHAEPPTRANRRLRGETRPRRS